MSKRRPLFQRITLAILIVGMVFVGTIGPIAAQPARAQMVVTDPVTGTNTTIKNIWDFLLRIVGGGAAVAVMNGMGYLAQKLAYDTAVFIASGGKGEGTLFENKPFGDIARDAALGAAGEALGSLSEMGFLGFNLCDPSAAPPSLRISIFLGIAGNVGAPPRPRCEWNDIAKNWDTFITSVDTGEALRGTFLSFQPGQSELSVGFGSNIKVLEYAGEKANQALKELDIGEGFKSLTNPISGTVKTPSIVVAQEAKRLTEAADTKDQNAAIFGPAISAGLVSILPAALATFTNTLTSSLMKRIFTEGLFDVKTVTCPGFDLFSDVAGKIGVQFGAFGSIGNTECALTNPEFAGRGGRAAAQAAFADFLTPKIIESQPYDAISEFTVCPEQFRTPTNCVLDSQFAAAVRQAQVDRPLTVRESIDRGYLHGDWPLVSANGADQARNSDPFCFTTGYCYSNLVKLRKARVIPIGWELAAAKAINGGPTLKQVVDGFNDCPAANEVSDVAYPWCHLIDPNFLLKYPVTQCKARVNGPTLLTSESDLRAQICVDTPSCIAESEDGACETGYGYCTREKNIWRLGGDECPGEYATCATYTDRRGASESLLSNTIDRGICSADNVGCRGYSLAQDPANGTGDWSLSGRVFLDRDAGTCEARDAGCSELYPRSTARVNLVRNSSFELDEDSDGLPDSWGGTVSERADSFVDSGTFSVRPSAASDLTETIWLEAGRTYTLSASAARRDAATAVTVNLDLSFRTRGGAAVNLAGLDTTCDLPGGNILRLPLAPAADSFERLGCRFTIPDNPLDAAAALDFALLSVRSSPGPDAWLDSVQIEEGPVFTAYHQETYVDASASFLRIPPDFLNCAGDPASDDPACADYSAICRADEVGCERYTPADGSPPVPGIIADGDRCPNECVGYATYRQEPASFDVGSFPLYFIPSTARQCSVSAAGCSEFTNLDTLAGGGEAREYYSSLRACVKPGEGPEAVYYTWEGSDTAGYQLKEWRFSSGDPIVGRDEEVGTRPPKLVAESYAAACTKEIYAAGDNPDCREFFDTSGNRSYRPYSRTVVVSPDCHPYRITKPAVDQTIADQGACGLAEGEWIGTSSQCVICAPFGGTWNATANECVYKGLPSESGSCSAAESGCRLYTGNAGRNVRIVFQDDFESGGRSGWSEAGTAVSAESTIVGEHSLRVDAGTDLTKDVSSASPLSGVFQGGTYYLSFWAKGRGSISAGFSGGTRTEFVAGTVALGGNWQVYNFGPVFINRPVVAGESLVFSGFAEASFIDNVILRQVNEAIAVVKDSWVTPSACDQTREGAALPQAMLGCASYTDRKGADHALTGFDSLCRDAAVGCQAFADTRASDSPGRETWNAMCVIAAPAVAPTACEIAGNTVCTVGVGMRSCRYNTPSETASVRCDLGSADLLKSRPCSIDGVFICAVPISRGGGLAPVTSCNGQPADTVVVPEDITRFIIEDQKFQCAAEKTGCVDAGLPKSAVCTLPDGADAGTDPDACASASCDCLVGNPPVLACKVASGETACRYPLPFREPYPAGASLSYEPVVVQNAPRTYERSLCTQNAVGCEEWTTTGSEGGIAYFKAPDDRLCEYRENVTVGGTEIDGWFREGTDTACDPAFIIGGTTYGLRRNGDPEYAGFAGKCEEQFAGCTEFRDPSDKNAALYPRGKPYYAIKNDKLDTKTCGTNVSRTTGCILFEDTSNPLLTASTELTYARSAAVDFAPVAAVACEGASCGQCQYNLRPPGQCNTYRWGALCLSDGDCTDAGRNETANCVLQDEAARSPVALGAMGWAGGGCNDTVLDASGTQITLSAFRALYRGGRNDANTVIKVKQDRVCGEWLSCRSKSPVWDQQTGNFKEVCNQVGVCDAYSGSGESIECTHWVTDRAPEILSEGIYRNRDRAASTGLEYSGYSIPHQYPVESLEQVTVGRFCTQAFDDQGNRRLCENKADCDGVGECLPEQRLVYVLGTCAAGIEDGEACTVNITPGTCYSNKCVVSISGNSDPALPDQPVPLQIAGENRNDTIAACRAYPEQNSPFPGSVVVGGVASSSASRSVVVQTWNPSGTGIFGGDCGENKCPSPESVVNGFQKAKICEKDQDCECSYMKATYGQGAVTRYFNPAYTPYEGLCQGGTKDGKKCTTNDECLGKPDDPQSTDVGTCNLLTRKDNVTGLEGYCLERDLSTPLNGQQFNIGDLASRACATWLPADRLAGSIDIYNNFAEAGFNPGGNVYACAVPEAYKISGVYGVKENKKSLSRTIGSDTFKISGACWEHDDGGGGLTLQHGDAFEDLEADPGDEQDPTNYCGADDGFLVISRTKGGTGSFPCNAGDDDWQYICVPNNSSHQAVPDKPPCRSGDAGGALSNAFEIVNNVGFSEGDQIDNVQRRNPNIFVVQGGSEGGGNLLETNDSITGPFADRGNILDVFADCEVTDAAVVGEEGEDVQNARNPGAVYFGCQDVVQVAVAGENPKAVTGNTGSGRVAPPGSGIIISNPQVRTLEYNWHAPPHPYGLVNTNDISRVTQNISAPIQLPYCPGPVAGLPKAAADPGAETASCVELESTSGLNCKGIGGSCDVGDYDTCIEKIVDGNSCGDGAIPIIGWCDLQEREGGRGGEDPDLSGKCEVGGLGNDKCPYKCIPLDSFHSNHQPCDAEIETYDSDEREAGRYIKIDSLPRDAADYQKLSNSRFNDCVRETPADTDAFVGFPDHFQARPYIDMRYSTERDELTSEQCDSVDNCRDYGADQGRSFATKIRQRLSQLFAKVYDAFSYIPREGGSRGEYRKDGASLIFTDLSGDIAAMGGAPPVIAAVGDCFEGSRCLEGAAGALSVNGLSSGDVVGGGGQLGVELKFYAYAQNDQMPLRQVVVDWGDGTRDGPFPGSYRNHRGFRRIANGHESLCDNTDFGTSSEEACDDSSPFVYAYTYTCNTDANGAAVCPANAGSCSAASDVTRDGVKDCVYNVRVQVKDNWGFCNGRCAGGLAAPSCYDADRRGVDNECLSDFSAATLRRDAPWTAFTGRIIVSPR